MSGSQPIILVVALTNTPIFANDWPQWRGPDRTGVSTETNWLANWPPAVVWSANIGTSCASVAVFDGRLYTVGQNDETTMNIVYCFNARTGDILWTNAFPIDYVSRAPMATPTVDGSMVYVHSQDNQLFCYDRLTGDCHWGVTVADDFVRQGMCVHGACSSPLVMGDRVIVNHGKCGTAVNKYLGFEVLWGGDLSGKPAEVSPVPITIAGVPHVITVNYDMDTWQYFVSFMPVNGCLSDQPSITHVLGSPPGSVKADPIVFSDTNLLVLCGRMGVGLYEIVYDPVNTNGFLNTIAEIPAADSIECRYSNPVRVGDCIYGTHSTWTGEKDEFCITCFRVGMSSCETVWNRPFADEGLTIPFDERPDMQLIAAGNRIVMMNADGLFNVMNAGEANYNDEGRDWIYPFGQSYYEGEYASPVVADGLLYVRGFSGDLICLRVGNGDPPDNDADGIPDTWEQAHFGSRTNCVPTEDEDEDRLSNEEEYITGTAPTNDVSKMKLRIEYSAEGMKIMWEGLDTAGVGYETIGIERYYRLESKTDLMTGSWQPVADYTNAMGAGSDIVFTNATSDSRNFYRVKAWLE